MAGAMALEGDKVLDLTWSGAGPLAIQYLGNFGATVVHVETKKRLDMTRRSGPFEGGEPDPDRSGCFMDFNPSKYGITLDLNNSRGLEVARKLVAWADVLGENFTPGVIARWGLDYEHVRAIRPDIIYFSSSARGQTGPHARHRSFGNHLVSLAGFTELAGWPGRQPLALDSPYTDYITPRLAAAAIIAALDHRRRTGQGLYIDLSQMEGGLQYLAPLVLDYTVNQRVATRAGNRCDYAAPHGVYPCMGQDRWLAIAVFTHEEWVALAQVMGDATLVDDPRFVTLLARKRHEDELDAIIADWTKGQVAHELMPRLQEAGVSAGVVQSLEDLHSDPQLKHRGHFVRLKHRAIGVYSSDGSPMKLSKTPGGPRFAAPCLGEHNQYVLKEILGYTGQETAELAAAGALE